MHDPRLNSVHLNANRRDAFRVARESLFNASGPLTIAAGAALADPPGSHTVADGLPGPLPAGSRFALADRDHVYPLKTGINTVGRLPDNDVVVDDPYVSRRHVAVLVHASGVCEIHDVASKNGTFLNGQPVRGATRLHAGDRLTLSDHELRLIDAADARPAPGDHTFAE